jgi:hypothetical protein
MGTGPMTFARVVLMCTAGCVPAGASVDRGPEHATPSVASVTAEPSAAVGIAEAAVAAPTPALAIETPAPKGDVRVVDPKASSGLVDFVAQMPERGQVWVGPLGGNGGRDVLVHVPAGAAADAKYMLVYHFHGTHSERVVAKQPGMAKKVWVGWDRLQQTIDAIAELQSKGETNVVLVYPLSAGKRREPGLTGWFNKEYDRMWMLPSPPEYTDDFDALHDEVRALLDREFGIGAKRLDDRVIAEGHSAGGIALRNIAVQGTRHVDEYLFLDASFQGWADGCHRAVIERKQTSLVSVVITNNGIADPFGKSDPWCDEVPRDAAAWQEHRGACERGAKQPPGSKKTCAALEEAALGWPLEQPWCDGMKAGFVDTPNAYLLRTKISHGKQPRHFAGGLELPADRGKK